jgi:hypothetical protein
LAGITRPLEQDTQPGASQPFRHAFLQAIAIDNDEVGPELSHFGGCVLGANHRESVDARSASQRKHVVTDR